MRLKSRGRSTLPARQPQVERLQELAQRLQLLAARLIVHPVHRRRLAFFQRFGGGDVGGDHEFLDQLVTVQTLTQFDAGDAAVGADQHAPLRHLQLEHAAAGAPARQRLEGAIERRDHRLGQRRRPVVGLAVAGRLHLPVGEPGGRAHHRPLEAVAEQPAVGIDPQVRGKTGPVLARNQRTPAI